MIGSPSDDLNDKVLTEYLQLILRWTGITMRPDRRSMLHGRLKRRIQACGLDSFEAYLDRVRSDAEEKPFFIELVTTNETSFFRTPRVWEHIEREFLPKWWAAQNGPAKLHAWSAASSCGAEAHTLAIIFQEFKEKNPGFDFTILGTDISLRMLEQAAKGRYSARSVDAFLNKSPFLFKKYLQAEGEGYKAAKELTMHIEFRPHNLLEKLAGVKVFDLVLLRNVLIYFQKPEQERVLKNIEPRVKKDGLLIIGESESLAQVDCGFDHVAPLIYKTKAA